MRRETNHTERESTGELNEEVGQLYGKGKTPERTRIYILP